MSRHVWTLVWLVGCGEPVLRNAPKPNPGAVAGVAAATAAAITLASPQTAAAQQEARTKDEPDDRGVKVKETVPGAVFDRLDHAPSDAGVDGAASADPAPSPARPAGAAVVPPPQAWTPTAPPSVPAPPAAR